MNFQPSYHELQLEERIREVQREIANDRLVARLPRRPGMWRRAVRLLGRGLVVVGTRMERVEQPEQTVIYGS